jgi:hypothetical protein
MLPSLLEESRKPGATSVDPTPFLEASFEL